MRWIFGRHWQFNLTLAVLFALAWLLHPLFGIEKLPSSGPQLLPPRLEAAMVAQVNRDPFLIAFTLTRSPGLNYPRGDDFGPKHSATYSSTLYVRFVVDEHAQAHEAMDAALKVLSIIRQELPDFRLFFDQICLMVELQTQFGERVARAYQFRDARMGMGRSQLLHWENSQTGSHRYSLSPPDGEWVLGYPDDLGVERFLNLDARP